MGIYTTDLRELVIRPSLQQLNEWSPAAENILLGTAARESQLGFRLKLNDNKGMGIYRLSIQTHTQIWDEFLLHDPELASRLRGLASQQQFLKFPHGELVTNLSYATGVAWMVYKRHNVPLPDANNPTELAHFWLRYYANRDLSFNPTTFQPDAELDKFISSYRKLVLRENKILAA